MRKLRHLSALLAIAAFLCGCATTPQGEGGQPRADIKIYTSGELAGTPYETVSRIWVDSWRTALARPTYSDEQQAIDSMRDEAARLGANALVNVVCFDQGGSLWFKSDKPAVLCYANAIRVKQGASSG